MEYKLKWVVWNRKTMIENNTHLLSLPKQDTPKHNSNHCLGLGLFNSTTLLDTLCQKVKN